MKQALGPKNKHLQKGNLSLTKGQRQYNKSRMLSQQMLLELDFHRLNNCIEF